VLNDREDRALHAGDHRRRRERVVIGAGDPNPANSGKAAGIFRRAGIEVRRGVLAGAARAVNPAFNKFMSAGLPYVTLRPPRAWTAG